MTPPAIALVLLAGGGALVGCSPAALPPAPICGAPALCPSASACAAGRCAPEGALLVPPSGVRVVLPPREVVVLASSGGQVGDTAAVGQEAGELLVLLRFATSYRDDAEIQRAFLVLDPVEEAPPAPASTRLEVARIVEPWTGATASWGRRPRLTVPELAAVIGPGKGQRVRLDVTELVRRWSKRAPDEHGIALLASSTSRPPTYLSTGLARSRGPALEVYLR